MILVLSLFHFRMRVTVLANGLVTSAIITEYLLNNTEFMSFKLTDFEVTRYGKWPYFCLAKKDYQ